MPFHSISHHLSSPQTDNKNNQNPAFNFCEFHVNTIKDASLIDTTDVAHDTEISGVGEIDINNSGVDQIVDEHHNYKITGLEYDNSGEIEYKMLALG